MDQETIWQIIDTSIKIGIGAIISLLLCSILMMRRNNTQNNTPKLSNRKLEILETISADVGNISHIFSKYSTLVVESIRYGAQWPTSRRQELDAISLELVSEFRKLADAEAKLLMLGEKTLEKNLRMYGARIAHFRKNVYVGRQDIEESDIAALKKDINLLREQFYEFLSRKYDRLLPA